MNTFSMAVPAEFSFSQCLDFLNRSPRELLHRSDADSVRKILKIGQQAVVFEIRSGKKNTLSIQILEGTSSPETQTAIMEYIREWFDVDQDLKPFYAMASKDKYLKPLIEKFYGYRIVGQPDLFESLVWAVLGQQINLQFAYTLKQRFVENFGEKLVTSHDTYYLFPRPDTVALLNDDVLLPIQFSRQKSKYVVNIAAAFVAGEISREKLQSLSLQEAKEKLMKIKGIGNWTANYALMKTFRYPDAFPLEDAGIYNVVKRYKKLDTKPTNDQVKAFFKKYKGWEAYATLYFWKSLA